MDSGKCDVCLAPDSVIKVPAADIRAAARNGFDPVRQKLLPGPPGSLIPSLARAMWQMLLNEGDAEWTFCARCMVAVRPYLPPSHPASGPEPEHPAPQPVAAGPDLLLEIEPPVIPEPDETLEIIPEISSGLGALLEPLPASAPHSAATGHEAPLAAEDPVIAVRDSNAAPPNFAATLPDLEPEQQPDATQAEPFDLESFLRADLPEGAGENSPGWSPPQGTESGESRQDESMRPVGWQRSTAIDAPDRAASGDLLPAEPEDPAKHEPELEPPLPAAPEAKFTSATEPETDPVFAGPSDAEPVPAAEPEPVVVTGPESDSEPELPQTVAPEHGPEPEPASIAEPEPVHELQEPLGFAVLFAAEPEEVALDETGPETEPDQPQNPEPQSADAVESLAAVEPEAAPELNPDRLEELPVPEPQSAPAPEQPVASEPEPPAESAPPAIHEQLISVLLPADTAVDLALLEPEAAPEPGEALLADPEIAAPVDEVGVSEPEPAPEPEQPLSAEAGPAAFSQQDATTETGAYPEAVPATSGDTEPAAIDDRIDAASEANLVVMPLRESAEPETLQPTDDTAQLETQSSQPATESIRASAAGAPYAHDHPRTRARPWQEILEPELPHQLGQVPPAQPVRGPAGSAEIYIDAPFPMEARGNAVPKLAVEPVFPVRDAAQVLHWPSPPAAAPEQVQSPAILKFEPETSTAAPQLLLPAATVQSVTQPEPAIATDPPQSVAEAAVPDFAPQPQSQEPTSILDLRAELRHCETLFFTFRFPQLVELSSQLIEQFPQCVDAYAYRSFAMLGQGRVDPQKAPAGELDLLLRDYYRACTGSISTQGATVCRLFLKLIFFDLVKRIRRAEPDAVHHLKTTDPLCGGAFALLDADFDRAQVCFDIAIAEPPSYVYACAGMGLLKLFQSDISGARHALARAGNEDEDIRMLARSLAVPLEGAASASEPAPVFEGDSTQLAKVVKVLDQIAEYKDRQLQQAGAPRGVQVKWESVPRGSLAMQRCIRQADQLWAADFPPLSKRLQLRGADLSRREFLGQRRTLALQKADLRNARLTDTSWFHINLDKSDFTDADLSGAQLVGVQCEQTTFRNAELKGALLDLASTIYPIDFSGANLTGAKIRFGRQFSEGAESFAPVRMHLTGAIVDRLTVELPEPEAERAVESLQYLLSGLTPLQRAKISIINVPAPPMTVDSRSDCFIATAACGSPCAYEVRQLRAWRDVVLRPSPLGRRFVRWYEQNSPPIAKWIETRPCARALVRALLIRPAAAIIRALHSPVV